MIRTLHSLVLFSFMKHWNVCMQEALKKDCIIENFKYMQKWTEQYNGHHGPFTQLQQSSTHTSSCCTSSPISLPSPGLSIHRDLIRSLARRREGPGGVCKAIVNSPRWDWLRSWTPLVCMVLWPRRCKKEGRDSISSCSSSGMPGWSCFSQLCFSNDSILRKRRNSRHSLGLVWPERVAGLYFFGCCRGHGLWGRSLLFFQNHVTFVSYVVLVCELILQK